MSCCEGKGYHVDVDSNGFKGDSEHMIIQRCDTCGRYETDAEAGAACAQELGTSIRGVVLRRPTKTAYYATIHVLIDAPDETAACDTLSENFRNPALGILDWGYVSYAGRISGPVQTSVPSNYEEGDFLKDAPKHVGL